MYLVLMIPDLPLFLWDVPLLGLFYFNALMVGEIKRNLPVP